jgi:gas vesicle protein
MSEIIVAIIGAITTALTALLGYRSKARQARKAQKAETEMRFQRAALDFDSFFLEWNDLQKELKSICSETCIDRFILLRAFNGKNQPEWTNAVFQYRDGDQKPISYIHLSLDDDYIERIRQIVSRGSIHFSVKDIPDSLIRKIYRSEEVKSAAWFHIASYDIDNTGSRMIAYCSFASHDAEEIPEDVLTRCRLVANRFRLIADDLAANATPVTSES